MFQPHGARGRQWRQPRTAALRRALRSARKVPPKSLDLYFTDIHRHPIDRVLRDDARGSLRRIEEGQVDPLANRAAVDNSGIAAFLDKLAEILARHIVDGRALRHDGTSELRPETLQKADVAPPQYDLVFAAQHQGR